MSADHKHEQDETTDRIVPITEWPVSSSETIESREVLKRKFTGKSQSTDRSSSIGLNEESWKKIKNDNDNDCPISISAGNRLRPLQDLCPHEKEPDVSTKIARWWRQKRALGFGDVKLPKCCPKSMLYHISRLPDCQSFLQKERKRLLFLLTQSCDKADVCAAIAGLDDYTEQFTSAFKYISQAVQLAPTCPEYQWLVEKISRQCGVLKEQKIALKRLEGLERCFPKIVEVPRVASQDLSLSDFQEKYLQASRPVIITDVVDGMTKTPFDFSLVLKHAGDTVVTTREGVGESLSWARLENKRETTVAELIQGVQAGSAKDFLFDWSLPLHCPRLAQEISLPSYFNNNFLLQTSPGSLYRDSWPSLFVAPEGATTQLHVDAFHSHFWMALFEGTKRWTFFDPSDLACLYPRWFQSMDPVFEVDLSQPDLDRHPLLTLTCPQQCVLQPGELLFVPAGSPHFVENLSATLAISSNYVDLTNYPKVCEELKTNTLQDERAQDLLQQLQDPAFMTKMNVTKKCNKET